jgi:1-pyrroline-5-carboxylate dehydrogenase
MNGVFEVPAPINEPVQPFAPGDPEREALKRRLADMQAETPDVPLIIGGEEIRTGDTVDIPVPHDHSRVLATHHKAGPEEIQRAIESALEAKHDWAAMRWEDRSAIFLKAAELLATTWRDDLNASTMLGQSKTAHQAEIDAACELIDFFRFNAFFAQEIYEGQPFSDPGMWNRLEYRPLEGFIYAISPFNFTSIGGNLSGAPALMGNTVIWKPSHSAVYSSYLIAKLLEEAGLPPGVINFLPGNAAEVTEALLSRPELAGIHFTGSTGVFQSLWRTVGERIARYDTYPRLVGETGGKDFILAHPSADVAAVCTAIIRGSFEYQGQKCSAASRVYVPKGMWSELKDALVAETEAITMGDVCDFRNFMGAMIHASAFEKTKGYIDRAASSPDAQVIAGGQCDDSEGWFVRPTIIEASAPRYESMCDEIFAPVVTVYAYPDDQWSETLDLVDQTGSYALTGAVFSQDRPAIVEATHRLQHAAGNFYINDKPTGAVVGQQPFGGARGSGTNDKAGSRMNLMRWVSPRTIKETFVPPRDYRYPFMDDE